MSITEVSKKIEKLYANGAIVNLGKNPRHVVQKTTNRPTIDYVTDGGLPQGRLVLIAGKPSSGKSSFAIQVAQETAQKVLYLDTEATLTTDYLESLGADPHKFSHAIPEHTEQLCDIIRREAQNFDVIIVDSINNSASEEQLQKTASEKTWANRANVLSTQLPIIISLCNQYDTTLIIISQLRDNMNKVNMYSPSTIIPGGNSLHHNSSLTIEMSPATKKKGKEKDDLEIFETVTGRMIRIHCSKNKVGAPFRTVEVEFTYGEGFTVESDIASSALRLNILERAGSWVKYKGKSIAQGIDNIVPILKDNPELLEELRSEVKKITEEQNGEN